MRLYHAALAKVANRGTPPVSFLDQLVDWAKRAPAEIFAENPNPHDIYASVSEVLGPWESALRRRAVMVEVLRVLAGFESSWNWHEGRDTTNSTSVTADTIEAGAWQVSANSMALGQDLKDLVQREVGTFDGTAFQSAMKSNHPLAMEYVARLLRHTVNHNGPVKRHGIDPYLRRDAVQEFMSFLG